MVRVPGAAQLARVIAWLPASVHAKLLAAFLAIVVLLIAVGAAGLQVLGKANHRAEELAQLQHKIAAYRQLQHDTTAQLFSVSAALREPNNQALDSVLRQLNQFGYDLARLQFVARDEVALLAQVQTEYRGFIDIVTRVVDLIREGRFEEGHQLQVTQAGPLADRLERLTNQLVNRAEADMVARIDANAVAYAASRRVVIGFALGSIALALLLGYVISWSLIDPVRRMEMQLREIASGDFTHHVQVLNRDELGTLASHLNRMNDELQRLYEQLETASQHKSRFLASMSHELRTPLNAVLGYTELILDGVYGEAPARILEVLERVRHSGRHLLGLINDVLDLSKIEAGQLTLVMQEYSLPDIVQVAITSVESLAREKHLTLDAQIANDLPRGTGDPRRLTQVLLNLVGNAIKFTEAGEVRIRASTTDGHFVVAVADTGPGVPETDQRRIFEEFQQAGAPNGQSRGGTGLGLAIARRIVELHGGRMGVESQPGTGATFWFEVPVRVDQRAGAP